MFRIIRAPHVAVVERLGNFYTVKQPGIRFQIPFVDRFHIVNLSIASSSHVFPIKTKDGVFCMAKVVASARVVEPEKYVYAAHDPSQLMDAHLEDAIRNIVPKFDLDHLFQSKEEIEQKILEQVELNGDRYGLQVTGVMITEIDPDSKVKKAMNKINASIRQKEATINNAEAEKYQLIARAQADAERKKLNGQGLADMRKAIMNGYAENIQSLAEQLGIPPKEAMAMTLTAQFIDATERAASSNNTKTVFYPTDLNQPQHLMQQLCADPNNNIKLNKSE